LVGRDSVEPTNEKVEPALWLVLKESEARGNHCRAREWLRL
jgi:hypothetical protein